MKWIAAIVIGLAALTARGQETKVLHDFEQPGDLRLWEFKLKSAQITTAHATHGKSALKIQAGEYMNSWRLPGDWSGFDSLDIDIFIEGDAPVNGSLLIADKVWQAKGGTYWNRHNAGFSLKPGANTLSIPVNGLYRGEAGSRNNDIKTNIDPSQIIRMDIGFRTKGDLPASIYIDHMRLVKESRPAGILAFDFGPESQAVFPGFTAVAHGTVHGQNSVTAGLRYAQSAGFARDDTFPTRLYQDFVNVQGNEFIVDVPNGRHHVWVVYDDLGYWGGETARFRTRQILAEGKVAWSEDRGENGPADYLFRFENLEPRPGDSIWDLYVAPLFAPRRFAIDVTDGKLNLRFNADGALATKVAAIIVYPDSNKAESEKWIAQIEQRNRAEFESRAVFLGPVAKGVYDGNWVGYPTLEDDISFVDAPGRSDGKGLVRTAAQGQRISLTFAVRPPRDLSATPTTLVATDLKGPAGAIPASAIDLRYVHHAATRGFNTIAYTITPESLRRVEGANLRLAKDLTRQFWITVSVPPKTPAGTYTGKVTMSAGDLSLGLPLTIEVLPIALDEPDFLMGFYGTRVPEEIVRQRGRAAAWRELFTAIKQAGMNTYSGGPGIPFSGLDAQGKPILDFSACDEFFRIARECGFDKEVNAYGGPGMVSGLHDGYVIGQTGRAWEQKTGKPFAEILKIVWTAVHEHAQKEGWPKIQLGFTDEPRVIDQVNAQLELMKLYRQVVPFVNIGGSYSVHWNKTDPLEMGIQEIFKTLNWSALNLHTQADLDKAKELGKELLIYNQGRTRYSFGAYQWAEMRKGVRGRIQWHLLALHGYQFFDLDGREPDTAMINWGRTEIIPTLHNVRCREGADDFRFATTLWNLATRKKDHPASAEAIEWLEQVNRAIPLNRNTPPEGFMGDEAFRNGCIERIRKLIG